MPPNGNKSTRAARIVVAVLSPFLCLCALYVLQTAEVLSKLLPLASLFVAGGFIRQELLVLFIFSGVMFLLLLPVVLIFVSKPKWYWRACVLFLICVAVVGVQSMSYANFKIPMSNLKGYGNRCPVFSLSSAFYLANRVLAIPPSVLVEPDNEQCTAVSVVNLLEDRETNSKDLIAIFYNEFRPRYRQNTSFALTPLVFDFRRNLNKSRKDASSSLATDAALVGFIAQIWEVNAREDLMVTLDPSTRNPFAWLEWQFTSREDRLLCEMLEKEISEALIKAKNSMLKQLNEDRVRYPADTSRYDELLSKVNHFEAK
jgi:hypothetical protein